MQRPALLIPLALACLFILVFASLPMQAQQTDPALATDHVRESTPNDFLRVTFVPAGVAVTTLARPGSLRAFATATAFYEPPLALKDFPLYSGLVNDDSKTLIAMRCQPPHPEAVDALLATWPNVFTAIQRDLPPESRTCNAENAPGTAANSTASTDDQRAFCFAHTYSDEPGDTVPISLAHTFSFAAQAFAADSTLAAWLKTRYGIFPAFSGLGFSVKDSYYLDAQHPMDAQEILVKSISPEYILKNASLKDAGCSCISVAPYPGRSEDLLDPEFIHKHGGDGECKPVEKLNQSKQ
jgi:hypothetical protein